MFKESIILASFMLPNIGAKEISGIDFDRDGVMYAHPDSGNAAEIYTYYGERYEHGSKRRVPIRNRDWEDISVVGDYIYILDAYGAKKGRGVTTYVLSTWDQDYNNGMGHHFDDYPADCEAMAFHNGFFYFIKKDAEGWLYKTNSGKSRKLVQLPGTEGKYVTGMDIAGDKLVISIHEKGPNHDYGIIEFILDDDMIMREYTHTFKTKRQLEAIAYDNDGNIVAVTEGGMLWVVRSEIGRTPNEAH
jgi:hypothetical protein